ncbi:MAG TPA: hypothetical protein P5305_04835 [Rubrivivax sp.]|nr:hypothetical protein [Rubrivivax sp.]
MKHIRSALDAVFACAVVAGCVSLALSVCWEVAAIVGGLLGLFAVAVTERVRR